MLRSYSPQDVHVSWQGLNITGFAPDSFIRVSRNSDVLNETVGAAGELSLTRVADKTGTIELELQQTSESNLLLSGVLATAELTGGVIPTGNFVITDPSGSVFVVALNAYLKTAPSLDLGADQNSRVWTFGCETLLYTSTPDGLDLNFTGITL